MDASTADHTEAGDRQKCFHLSKLPFLSPCALDHERAEGANLAFLQSASAPRKWGRVDVETPQTIEWKRRRELYEAATEHPSSLEARLSILQRLLNLTNKIPSTDVHRLALREIDHLNRYVADQGSLLSV